MSDPVVYRSENPGVLAAWKGACAAISEYVRQTQAVLDRAGLAGRSVWRSSNGWDWGKVRGISAEGGTPEGWRMAAGKDYAVPDMRTSAGRKVKAALDAVPHPGEPTQRLIGMPADVLAGAGRIWTPDVRVLGGAVWAEWDLDPEAHETSFSSPSTAVDSSLWQRARLSEYYAAREDAEAA